ncbi:phospholipase D family protein (plasmid) [Burkholderia multivorans]|uniref:phospholipase D n=1 Tax=Burkholderia multivorans TaxID=87883 RepID=A0AAP2HQ04_9BURK|nr:phospholipase D family protein [Burkholderia multivorans]MBU9360534.1 phospholipase D family protein [Burkholderia multivorans]MCO1459973.1 phospholipase D family protein [Burkholderia multivorans]UQO21346.1 phospholipase D family protein [Burkholderia multivorans]
MFPEIDMSLSLLRVTQRIFSGVAAAVVACAIVGGAKVAHAADTVDHTTIQVGFSPDGSAEALVLDIIGRARYEIRVMAYSFTSPEIARALLKAKRSGVDVQLVVDAAESKNAAAAAALNLLSTAGVPIRLNDRYRIQHDKVIVVDRKHVETGSFNFSRAAARSNSENVVVLWDRSDVAAQYLSHWRSRWDSGTPFRSAY